MCAEIGVKLIPFNAKMRAARKEIGLTQSRLGELVGVSASTISALERWQVRCRPRTLQEIAGILGIKLEELFPYDAMNGIMEYLHPVEISLPMEQIEALIDERKSVSIEHEIIERLGLEQAVFNSLLKLGPREAEVLVLRFGLDGRGSRTLEEAGEILSVTRERVRTIEEHALKYLRHPVRNQALLPYSTEAWEQRQKWRDEKENGRQGTR